MPENLITPHHSLPLMAPLQAQKHLVHNDALVALDRIVQLSVLSVHGDPDTGLETDPLNQPARYIVAASATGQWADRDGQIAIRHEASWQYLVPSSGWQAYNLQTNEILVFRDSEWRPLLSERPYLGLNASADETNRLSVSSSSVLFNHDGSDCRLVVNRDNAATTASLIFQTEFAGQAEIGLTGTSDLSVRVSPDGQSWADAIQISTSDGSVALPSGATIAGDTAATKPDVDAAISTALSGVLDDALAKKPSLLASTDLNSVVQTGHYHVDFNSTAASGINFPSDKAGMLTVVAGGQMTYQTYHVYASAGSQANAMFVRSRYLTSWCAWREI